MSENLLVRVGNGSRQHFAYRYEIDGKGVHTFLACGSNKIRGLQVIGQLELTTYGEIPNKCQKCELVVDNQLSKVVA